MNRKRLVLAGSFVLAAVSWVATASADERHLSPPSPGVAALSHAAFARLPRLQAAPPRHNPFGSQPLAVDVLAVKRGGESVSNEAQLSGAVSGNQAINVSTGGNSVSDGAFAGSAGLSTVIQNTGNNVLIQNSTIVNVQLK